MARVLYTSYDGLCDPLGQSQILPYLTKLRAKGHEIHIISFEKVAAEQVLKQEIEKQCASAGIHWHPMRYHKSPPVLSTLWDLFLLKNKMQKLHQKHSFHFTHCRSYICALASLGFYQKLRIPFIFDMRGFWADERVDGKLWNLKNPLYWLIYRFFKKKERELLETAKQVVCLTEAAKEIMLGWQVPGLVDKLHVIPCCVDLDKFSLDRSSEALRLREKLDIPPQAKVIAYSGSIGTWYLLPEMLRFAKPLVDQGAYLCFFTKEKREYLETQALKQGIPLARFRVLALSHQEMPIALQSADLALSFIQASFSKKSSSPTKLGEYFASGLPVVSNQGVGDVDLYFKNSAAGILIKDLNNFAPYYPIDWDSFARHKNERKQLAETFFSLEKGAQDYATIYEAMK